MRERKLEISIGVIVLLIAAALVFDAWFLLGTIKRASKSLVSERGKLVTLDTRISKLEEFNKTARGYEEDLLKVNSLLINVEVPVEFISFVEGIALKYDCGASISPGAPQYPKKEKWAYVEFGIEATCSYENTLRMVREIEECSYLAEVKSFGISRSGDDARAILSVKVLGE